VKALTNKSVAKMRTEKTGTTGYQNFFHIQFFLFFSKIATIQAACKKMFREQSVFELNVKNPETDGSRCTPTN
jgi:hypothetical protein